MIVSSRVTRERMYRSGQAILLMCLILVGYEETHYHPQLRPCHDMTNTSGDRHMSHVNTHYLPCRAYGLGNQARTLACDRAPCIHCLFHNHETNGERERERVLKPHHLIPKGCNCKSSDFGLIDEHEAQENCAILVSLEVVLIRLYHALSFSAFGARILFLCRSTCGPSKAVACGEFH